MAATARSGRTYAPPALSGLLLALCFPPAHVPFLPFLALVPLALWLPQLGADRAGAGTALRGGLVTGGVYFGLLLHWVAPALAARAPGALGVATGVAALVVITAGLAALIGVAVWLLHNAVVVRGAPLWLALPVVWTGTEWARGHLPSSLALPWLGLGTSMTSTPDWVGIAELVGARGVTFWIALVAGLLATGLASFRERGSSKGWIAAAGLALALPIGWGVWRAGELETRPLMTVAVVQPNSGARAKVGAQTAQPQDADELAALLDRLLGSLESGQLDLVVLPEMTVRSDPRSDPAPAAVGTIGRHSERLGAPIVFGGLGTAGSAEAVVYNSAYMMEPGGLSRFRYDKRLLVPLVEQVPFADGPYAPGDSAPSARTAAGNLGVLICYESSDAELARALRRSGADVLVNITNDGWFASEDGSRRTTAFEQHPAHLVMRAIETRVPVVRAATTGISFTVDPLGRIHDPTEPFREGVRVHAVVQAGVATVFLRLGDVVGRSSAAVTFILLLLAGASARAGRRISADARPSLDPNRPVV